jgi:hypothetical protein
MSDEDKKEPPEHISHLAGESITVDQRYMRQRCVWCGAVLIDYDLANISVQIPKDGSEPQPPGAWEPYVWVAVAKTDGTGACWVVNVEDEKVEGKGYPVSSCMALDPAVTA